MRDWHVIREREYRTVGDLLDAVLTDDRRAFDERLEQYAGEGPEELADLIGITLAVARVFRFRIQFVPLRPDAQTLDDAIAALAASEFCDLVDIEFGRALLDRIFAGGPARPTLPSLDHESLTTCLGICAWILWRRVPPWRRDRRRVAVQTYRGYALGLRLRRIGRPAWIG